MYLPGNPCHFLTAPTINITWPRVARWRCSKGKRMFRSTLSQGEKRRGQFKLHSMYFWCAAQCWGSVELPSREQIPLQASFLTLHLFPSLRALQSTDALLRSWVCCLLISWFNKLIKWLLNSVSIHVRRHWRSEHMKPDLILVWMYLEILRIIASSIKSLNLLSSKIYFSSIQNNQAK